MNKTSKDSQGPVKPVNFLIIIVCYKSQDFIGKCLESVIKFVPDSLSIVVDNSNDELTRLACENVSTNSDQSIRYLSSTENLGYSAAINRALEVAPPSKYVLILNPDIELLEKPDTLTDLLLRASLVSGALADNKFEFPTRIRNARPKVTLGREFLRAILGSRVYQSPIYGEHRILNVEQLGGAYMLTSRSWLEANKFDERFELYYEDVEISDRARNEDGLILDTRICAVHFGGESSKKSPGISYLVLRVSRARYLKTRYPKGADLLIASTFILEVFSRTIARSSEPMSLRLKGCRLAIAELRKPNSIRLLNG